jgi:O-antigen ligase
MPRASTHFLEMDGTRSSVRTIDGYALIPIIACVYATIVFPLIIVSCDPSDSACLMEARPESKIFWPALAAISAVLAVRNFSRLRFPPHILWLFGYLALAGASVLWAFKPEASFIRFSQQAMIVVSIVVPAMLAARQTDLMRSLFLCFAVATILNVFFVLGRPPIDTKFATWGYPGYFPGKNYLGECEAIALLLALHETIYPGKRRLFGILVAIAAMVLLVLSNSKTAMGLSFLVPLLAGATLLLRRVTRLSTAIILLSIPVVWLIFTTLTGFSIYRVSHILYGDSTFTGRSIIWDFVESEIEHRPLLGWGYQSFWLVGPDAPSIVNAPGWVKDMPNGHNGYLDVKVELGYAGYALFMAFMFATLHAIGRVADRAPIRAWLLLTLALQIIITNGLESIWMRGFEMLWVVFLILVAEIGRYWKPVLSRKAAHTSGSNGRGPRPTRHGSLGPARGVRRPAVSNARFHPLDGDVSAATPSSMPPAAREAGENPAPAVSS